MRRKIPLVLLAACATVGGDTKTPDTGTFGTPSTVTSPAGTPAGGGTGSTGGGTGSTGGGTGSTGGGTGSTGGGTGSTGGGTGSTGSGTGSTGTGTATGTATGGTSTLPAVELVEGGVQVCGDPSRRDESPFDRVELGYVESEWTGLRGAGVAAADLDGDGRFDIVRTRPDGLELWSQRGDGWVETGLLDHIDGRSSAAASLADYDADGDLDVFIGRYPGPNLLLRNDDGLFLDVAASLGLERFPYLSLSGAWADIDLDGDLDLLVGNYAEVPPRPEATKEPSRLYLGSGGGSFEDVSHWLPERIQLAYTFMNPLIDTNGDGYPEIVNITDFFYIQPSGIFVNQAGTGFLIDLYNGFQMGFNGMGVSIADANGDRIPDFVQSSTGRLSMMLSVPAPDNPSGAIWIEHAGLRGLAPNRDAGHTFGWGTEWVDIDNDGDLDVAMLWGFWDDFPSLGPLEDPTWAKDALWIADDEDLLVDRAGEWGFDDTDASRGLIVADLDRNGWLDAVKSTINGPTIVLTQRCGSEAWLGIELTDLTAHNRDAVGARIEVVAGDRSWLRWITAGSTGMFSGGPPTAHVGLGDVERVDRVEILWPDQELSVFEDVAVRQNLEVVRRRR